MVPRKEKKKLNTDPIPIWKEDGDDEGRSQLSGPLCLAADFPSKASWKLWDLMFSLLYRVPHREMCPSSHTLQPPVLLQTEMMELTALCLFVQTCRQFLCNRWPIGMQPNCRKRWRTVTHRLNFFGWSRILSKKKKKKGSGRGNSLVDNCSWLESFKMNRKLKMVLTMKPISKLQNGYL